MSIAGACSSLNKLLGQEYRRLRGDDPQVSFRLFTTSDFDDNLTDTVSLFVYRVEPNPSFRHDAHRSRAQRSQTAVSLAVDLHVLLVVWASNAERQVSILGDCMAILDANAILARDQLDPTYIGSWEENTSIKVTLTPLSNEDLLRLWDSLPASYRLSVPYLVRTIRLAPKLQPRAELVTERQHIYVPRKP